MDIRVLNLSIFKCFTSLVKIYLIFNILMLDSSFKVVLAFKAGYHFNIINDHLTPHDCLTISLLQITYVELISLCSLFISDNPLSEALVLHIKGLSGVQIVRSSSSGDLTRWHRMPLITYTIVYMRFQWDCTDNR